MIAISKKASMSNGKNSLENFDKLRAYAYQGSILTQKQAKKDGIIFTIMKNGKIYKVFPDGLEVEQNKITDQNSFEPISV